MLSSMTGVEVDIGSDMTALTHTKQMRGLRTQRVTRANVGDGENDHAFRPHRRCVVHLDAAPGARVGTVQATEDTRRRAARALAAVLGALKANEARDLLPVGRVARSNEGQGDLLIPRV